MPWSLERHYGRGDIHFVTCSCYRRAPLLNSVYRRDLLLSVLERVRRRYGFVVLGYVVMPEHLHLLISEPERGDPSSLMKAIKLGLAMRIRAEQGRQGIEQTSRMWEARFYDFNVCTVSKRIEKLRYIHRNPVTRGLVKTPEDWPWSSFRAYAFHEQGEVRVNDWSVHRLKMIESVSFEES